MKLRRLHPPAHNAPTLGHLTTDDNQVIACTLELRWHENQTSVSCIPAGTYTFHRYHSPHFGYDVFKSEDVPHREAIEMHIANTEKDLRGCIGIGTAFGLFDGVSGITESKKAFTAFMHSMTGVDAFTLTVSDP